MQKRPVLLLELCISLVLIATLLGIVFASYREMCLANFHLQRDKERLFNTQRAELRLSQIFRHLQAFKKEDHNHYLLVYDNQVDRDPRFRGVRDGMLYVEKEKLVLVTWPETGEARQEVILSDIRSLLIDFFDPDQGIWTTVYPQNEKKPFMMKVTLCDPERVLPFFL